MENKVKAHVSEAKKGIVKELAELMKKKSVMIASIKSLPDPQFQDIKKKMRGKAVVKVAKKNLIKHALEQVKDENLKKILEHISADYVLIFSDEDVFALSGILADNKSPAKAKIGQEAPEDIKVEAGPTSLMAGPDISALSSVGLQPKVENGKISVLQAHVIVKKGEKINEKVASVLVKLDITPFSIGIEPLVAFSEGKIYLDVKIDKEEALKELVEGFSRGLGFAVSLDYVCKESLPYVLSKAGSHEKAIGELIKEEVKEEPKTEEKKEDVQETKSEEEN